MGTSLHKLGAYFYRHPWRVITVWLVIFAGLAVLASTQYKQPSNAISIPGTPADTALSRMSTLFPDAGKGSARVVVKTPSGKTIDQYRGEIEEFVTDTARIDGVSQAVSPFLNTKAISENRQIAIIQIQLDQTVGLISTRTMDQVTDTVNQLRTNGLTAEMGGDIVQKAPSEILGLGEIFGLVLAICVLWMIYQSALLAGLSLTVAVFAVALSMTGLFSLSQVITISATTPVLAVMLGLAVGIDYSLFIVNKYQRLLRDDVNPQEAAARANATAGNAVLFAAATVVVALASLAVVNIPFMTTMGLSGAATIALAAVVAVTLVPALLGVVGTRLPARAIGKGTSHKVRHRIAYAWVNRIGKHPIAAICLGVAVIAAIAWPIGDLKLGLPLDEYAAPSSTERKAYDLVTEGFGKGYNSPLAVVVERVPAVTDQEKLQVKQALMQQYQAAAMSSQPVDPAAAMAQLDAAAAEVAKRAHLQKIADAIKSRDGVSDAVVGLASDDGTYGVIQVIPKSAPFDTATADLIDSLRDPAVQQTLSSYPNAAYSVTGSTAMQNDINKKLSAALPVYLAVVVGLSLLILIVAFRSIVVPIKATLGFILSVVTMFGALVAVFQWGWFGITDAPGPIISFIPIIATGILFGLAMDYEFFLVSSMHEAHSAGMKARKAVIEGFSHSSRVVAAAAIIMTAVFGGFIFNHDSTVQAIGFGLAIGILVDAFIVRLMLVPAVLWLIGDAAWWLPRWLDRVLPHISIEGEESSTKK